MTGQAERSTINKQPFKIESERMEQPERTIKLRNARGRAFVDNLKTQALEAELSWTPWQALATPGKMGRIGRPEAEPSWTTWKTQALEAEPSWTPWQALATLWKMGYVVTPEAEPSRTSWKTKALEAEPSWTPW